MFIRSIALTLAALCITASAFAAGPNGSFMPLPNDSEALALVEGRLVGVKATNPHCPPNAMCEAYSIARISFTLGCVDTLAPVTVSSMREGNKLVLNVTAFAITNKNSRVVRCIRANEQFVDVNLGLGYIDAKSVEVRFARSGILSTGLNSQQ